MNEKNKPQECANAPGRSFTAEEVAKSLRRSTYGPDEHMELVAADILEAQAKRIKELEEKLRWIPVTERMPETVRCAYREYSEAVEVVTAGRKVMIAVWDGVDWNCAAEYWEAWGDPITHWRNTVPLPKGPDA